MSSSSATTYFNRKNTILCLSVAFGIVSYISWRKYYDIRRRSRRRKQGSVNIGGIFGMDVGGTLTKIVYFEAKLANTTSVQAGVKNTSTSTTAGIPTDNLYFGHETATTRTLNDVGKYENVNKMVNNNYNQDKDKLMITATTPTTSSPSIKRNNSLHKLDEPDHQRALHQLYDDMKQIGNDARNAVDPITTRDEQLSFYSPLLEGRLHFLHFETRNMATAIQLLGTTAITENIRSIGCTGGGALKYARMFQDELGITFSQQDELASLVKGMHFALTNMEGECYTYRNRDAVIVDDTSAATIALEGDESEEGLSIDRLSSPSITTTGARSRTPTSASNASQESHNRTASDPDQLQKSTHNNTNNNNNQNDDLRWRKDLKDRTVKVFVNPFNITSSSSPSSSLPSSRSTVALLSTANFDQVGSDSKSSFRRSGSGTNNMPYLVVNVGSGVSILKVTSPTEFERVSGSSIGGGTYWGLSRLLTRCARYEEVLDMAETGDACEVDMLVKDIYGGNYDHMNLSGAMVASSFGKLVMKDNPRDGIKEEDMAIALLMMITNNIGQVAYLNAKLHRCTKIFFVGSFLRHNTISCRRLAFAIDFWSKGEMEALFLTHEGYFGALGTFLQSAFGDDLDRVLSQGYGGLYGSKSNGNGMGSDVNGNESLPTSRSTVGMEEEEEEDESGTISPRDRKSGYNSTNSNKNKNRNINNRNCSINFSNNNRKSSSMYGIDSEFLNFLRDWQPLAFSALRGSSSGGGNNNKNKNSPAINESTTPTKENVDIKSNSSQQQSISPTSQNLQQQLQTPLKPDFRHAYSENNNNNHNNSNSSNNNDNANFPLPETSYVSLNNSGSFSTAKKSNSADAINNLVNASLMYDDSNMFHDDNNNNSNNNDNNNTYGKFPISNSRVNMNNISNGGSGYGGSVVSLDDLDIQRSSTAPLPSRPSDQFLSLSLHDDLQGRYHNDDDGDNNINEVNDNIFGNDRIEYDTNNSDNTIIDLLNKDYLQGLSASEEEDEEQQQEKERQRVRAVATRRHTITPQL